MKTVNYFCILSAGKGIRLGFNKNKGLINLAGKTILGLNLEKLNEADQIDKILVVTNSESKDEIDSELKKYKSEKLYSKSILGGYERQDSALAGLKFFKDNSLKERDIVLFHNVANPFFSISELNDLILNAKTFNAAVLAQKMKDTIRKVDENLNSSGVIPRKDLYRMQTPQALEAMCAVKSFKKAYDDKYLGTDDVELAENAGFNVKIVECSDSNFKITTKEDYYLAEYILEKK